MEISAVLDSAAAGLWLYGVLSTPQVKDQMTSFSTPTLAMMVGFATVMLFVFYLVLRPDKAPPGRDDSNPLKFKCKEFALSCDFEQATVQLTVAYTTRVFDLVSLHHEASYLTETKDRYVAGSYSGMVGGQSITVTGPGKTYSSTKTVGKALTLSGSDAHEKTPLSQEFHHISAKSLQNFEHFWATSFSPRRKEKTGRV